LGGTRLLFANCGWPASKSGVETALRRALAVSGLPPHRCYRFKYHALRGACGDQLDRIHPEASGIVLGHRGGVTRRCYLDQERIMRESLDRLPQPRYCRQAQLF
jgi:hypothetical protein